MNYQQSLQRMLAAGVAPAEGVVIFDDTPRVIKTSGKKYTPSPMALKIVEAKRKELEAKGTTK